MADNIQFVVLENDDICIRNFPSNKAVGYQIGPVMFTLETSLL